MHSLLVKEHLNTKCPKLEKMSLAETLSGVTNSSILENPQFGGVSVVVAMVIVITTVRLHCPITTLHND